MIYLDNAATSFFKPHEVIDAINYDLRHSANSGRSGHRYALDAALKIENCRDFLRKIFGAESYDVIFTKNCTEALNLAIFGTIKGGEQVVTSVNEHNSVLRPLYELERRGQISVSLLPSLNDGSTDVSMLENMSADMIVLGGACNVTGAATDIRKAAEHAHKKGALIIVDGAQSVPVKDINLEKDGIDMLACSGHKGLHGPQGVGFLLKRSDISLKPLVYGGTGTASSSVYQPVEAPEAYEAGTLFAGGIAALQAGAMWTTERLDFIRKHLYSLTQSALYNLQNIGCTTYSLPNDLGIVAFNVGEADSAYIAQLLADNDIAVRGGLHCAPLVHRRLGTSEQGAVRASFGIDSTHKDVATFCKIVENIAKKLR